MRKFLASCVQMTSGPDRVENLKTATGLVETAARRGAELVVLPELFNCLAMPDGMVAQAEAIPGPPSEAMSQLAARLGITLLAGSIAERVADEEKVFNSSLLFSPEGKQLAKYRKIHLFDINLPGHVVFQESRFMQYGQRLVVTDTPLGRLGQAHGRQQRGPALGALALADGLLQEQGKLDVLKGRQHGHQVEGLKDEANGKESQARQLALGELGRVVAVDEHDAAGSGVDAADQVEQGRLAAAGGPGHGEKLAGPNREVDAAHGRHGDLAQLILFDDIGELHDDAVTLA